MRQPTLLAIATAALMAQTPALATATASATITNLTFTLVDLDPNDGITPSATFQGIGSLFRVGATNYAESDYPPQFYGSGPFGPGTAFATVGGSQAQIEFSGPATGRTITGQLAPMKISLSGVTNGSAGPQNSYGGFSTLFELNSGNFSQFSISAKTQLILTGFAQASASVTVSDRRIQENAVGSVSANFFDRFGRFQERFLLQAIADNQGGGMSKSFADNLNLTFVNNTLDTLPGGFNIQVQANGNSQAPIPEPSTYALLIAGLFAVGLASRRQRQRAGAATQIQ